MSERYIPPPPPYQLSIQHDQKVTEELHTLEPSKIDSSQDEEWNDSKYSLVLTDKALKDAALHNISKHPARLDGVSLRTRSRPLPSRPIDPPGSQEQGYKLHPIADIKSDAVQNHRTTRLRTAASMLFPAPSFGEPTHHLSPSVQPSPLHYPSPSSYDTPRRKHDDRWPVPAYSSLNPGAEARFRRSSHTSFQSPQHDLPQKNSSGMRLSFDPSVAYSDQATTPTTRREAAASLYASAVSSHLPIDNPTTYGSRQTYAFMRPTPRGNETARRDNIDRQSLWSLASHPPDPMSSCTSMYTSRPKTSGGYEPRWAASETDIARDIYHR